MSQETLPPQAAMHAALDQMRKTLEEVSGATYSPSATVTANTKHRAAVLILLLPRVDAPAPSSSWFSSPSPADVDVLLTRRALNMRIFPGHTAFPGGKMEPDDVSIVHTALREAHEEVGVLPEEVTVLGTLPPIFTRYGHLTYGVVGFLDEPARAWRRPVNDMEIHSVFRLPLRRFLSAERLHLFRWRLPLAEAPMSVLGMVDFVREDGEEGEIRETWGMTASFAIVAAALFHRARPDFPDFYVWPGMTFRAQEMNQTFDKINDFFADVVSKSKL